MGAKELGASLLKQMQALRKRGKNIDSVKTDRSKYIDRAVAEAEGKAPKNNKV